jgi:hypothetical protein
VRNFIVSIFARRVRCLYWQPRKKHNLALWKNAIWFSLFLYPVAILLQPNAKNPQAHEERCGFLLLLNFWW